MKKVEANYISKEECLIYLYNKILYNNENNLHLPTWINLKHTVKLQVSCKEVYTI